MRRFIPVVLVMSLSACKGVGKDPVPPAPTAGREEPAPPGPAPEPAPEVAPPKPKPVLEPPRLAVAFEGRCRGLAASVLDDQVLVHLAVNSDWSEPPRIFRLDAQGQPAEELPRPPEHTLDPQISLSNVFSFTGRWPDQVYASVSVGSRGDYDTGFIRFDGKAWSGVHPLGPDDRVTGVLKWHDRSIVAIACDGECVAPKLPVIRGAPKGPRTDRLREALAACESVSLVDVAAIETGDLVAVAHCQYGDGGVYAARWKPDELAGDVKRLLPPGRPTRTFRVAHDGRETFWIGLGGDGKDALFRSTPGKWDEVETPAGKALADIAVDAGGSAWLLRTDGLWRREGEKWIAEQVSVGQMRRLLGVEQGTPWVLGEALARGVAGGPWHRVEVPAPAFFPDRRLSIGDAEVDRAGDVWLDANFTVIRKDKNAVGREYQSIVTSRPVTRPLRCGEVAMSQLKSMFVPWPTGADASCKRPLVLLQRQEQWKPGNTYPSYGKALRGATDVGAPRFAELEIGGERLLGAFVDDMTAAKGLIARARKAHRWKFPETVCGDEEVLTRAGVKIHRELAVELATGQLHE